MYLKKINNWYYYRIKVPKDLVQYFNRCELKKSLKTQVAKEAKFLVTTYNPSFRTQKKI